MDITTTNKTAAHLYRATAALVDIWGSSGSLTVSQEEVRNFLSMPSGKLSIASVVTSGADRATRLAAGLQENLFPALPTDGIITGVILVMYNGGDMTTEEYLVMCNRLLEPLPDEIPTIVTLSHNDDADNSLKGTLLISWMTSP
jgi:hypothetical protein